MPNPDDPKIKSLLDEYSKVFKGIGKCTDKEITLQR